MTFPRAVLVFIVSCSFATLAQAHEGHGTPGSENGIVHYLLSPYHLLPLVLLAIALIVIRRFTKFPRTKQLLRITRSKNR